MSRSPSTLEIAAACETLRSAGWVIQSPKSRSLELISVSELQQILHIGLTKAREVASELPGTIRLPGGDIRIRLAAVEDYINAHPLHPTHLHLKVSAV